MSKTCFFIYDYFLPAYKAGGPTQSLLTLSSALKEFVDVRVICSNRDADGSFLNVPCNKWIEYHGIKVFYCNNGFEGFKREIKASDVLFINGIYSIQYNLLPLLFLRCRKIVSVRGMLHTAALAQKKFKKTIYLSFWKLVKLYRRCEFHATNQQEETEIKKVFGKLVKVWTIPNLVKANKFVQIPYKPIDTLFMCTVALISPMKNHYMVLQALQNCTQEISYFIYGPVKEKSYWQQCERLIKNLPRNITVKYLGEVEPESVWEVISRSHIYIQPSVSENFGHSLCEALTIGRPIITSHTTPWNALRESKAGINVSVENTRELTNAISYFAEMENAEIERWSTAANYYINRAFNLTSIRNEYLKMFGWAV